MKPTEASHTNGHTPSKLFHSFYEVPTILGYILEL
jgi:hypothetical protein